MLNFITTHEDSVCISLIAERATKLAKAIGVTYTFIDAEMDICACHANGCSLKLDKLLGADDFNFTHDVFGIRRHLNRQTGVLEDCFLPRFAA